MAKLLFTNDELISYFNGSLKHKAYTETVRMSKEYRHHAEGICPEELIDERRPSESAAVKDYRKKIWKANTKPTWGKVVTELNKIRRASEWMIKYDDSKVPARVRIGETLKDYCEMNFPMEFSSVTNWVFSVLLPQYLKDPNSLIAIFPLQDSTMDTGDYVKPFPHVFDSWQVLDYVQGDYAVVKSTDKVIYQDSQGQKHFGEVYYVFTTTSVIRFEETKGSRRLSIGWQYDHNLGKLPVFRVKGLLSKTYDNTYVYKSRLDDMMPRLDEALREYSDLQAEVVQHIFSTPWEIVSDDCTTCKGHGKIKSAGIKGEMINCHVCGGSGGRQRGPYSKIEVRAPMGGEKPMPLPPAGYVEKNVEIVRIQDERIDKHEFKALSAVNMEYLAQTPLNESGKAKEVDKDALNNFVHAVAEDIVWSMDKTYYFINEMRYFLVVADENERKGMLPYIAVPEKFDLLSSTYLEEQISKQKENKGNPVIITAMEIEYVNKKFVADHSIRDSVLLMMKLDPLQGVNEEDRASRLAQGGITKETYVLSCNIREFIDRAVDEKGDAFYKMKPKEQKELLRSYAKEQIVQDSAKTAALNPAEDETEVDIEQETELVNG